MLEHFADANVLGVTATPDRSDKQTLGQYFDSQAYEYSMSRAIREKYLVPIKAQMIPLELDISSVSMSNGDYAVGEIGTALEPYLEQIAVEMRHYCQGRKTVVFLPLIATSQKFCRMLNDVGLRACEVNGNSDDREQVLADFEAGRYDVLCNSMLLTEGWDCPAVDCIVILRPIVKLYPSTDTIVLDFFSGFSTTAHAVMQLNAEDGGHRKFIMVQLPEVCDEKSEAFKAGYPNICEIGKERIRRAAKKIAEEKPDKSFDGGFRVFKLDESNMNDVYYSAGEYTQDMLTLMERNIKPDRADLDLLFGCLLEWGLPLSMPYTFEQIEGCPVHTYNDGDLIACFDENIPNTVIKEIAKRQPFRAVFRDSSFANSPAKINVGEIFKMLAPNTRVKVI